MPAAVRNVAAARFVRVHQGGDTFTTSAVVPPAAILAEWQNAGTPVFDILGDGRIRFQVLASAPAVPVLGDMWFDGDSLTYQSSSGPKTLLTGLGGISIVVAAAVVAGRALTITATGLRHAESGEHIVGTATTSAASGSIAIASPGEYLSLADWTAVTGTADLVLGSVYSLTTAGQLATSGGSTRVGVAVSARTLLIEAVSSGGGGSGLPAGGTVGQLLRKNSATDGDASWWTAGTASTKDFPVSGNATATQVVLGSDTRLTDARTPTAHAAGHSAVGADPVNHDTLLNYQGVKHIDHSTVNITAGTGLSGGGDISASRTLSVDFGSGHNQVPRGDELAGKEPALGNPSVDGYVLASTTTGTRTWVLMPGGGGLPAEVVTALPNGFETVVGSVAVPTVGAAHWEMVVDTGGTRVKIEVEAEHDASTGDATAVSYTVTGLHAELAVTAGLSGTGAGQLMEVRVQPSVAGWTARSRLVWTASR